MKKILFGLFAILLLNNNVNASVDGKEIKKIDNRTYTITEQIYACDGNIYSLEEYIPVKDKIILFSLDGEKTYSDGKCEDLTMQDKLDIQNKLVKHIDIEADIDETITKIYDIYNGYSEGYVLNTEEYDEDTEYYIYNEEEEYFDTIYGDDIDKSKIKTYYVSKYFKHISNTTLDKNKKYYYETGENNLFVENKEEISDDNILRIYEIIDKDDLFQNEKKYVSKEKDRLNVIEKNNIDIEEYNVESVIIDNKVYYLVEKFDDELDYTYAKYYDKKGNEVFNEFDNKIVDSYDNYTITTSFDYKEFGIYDEEHNLITTLNFDSVMRYNIIVKDEDIFVLFNNEENTESYSYLIDKEIEINYNYYFIIIGVIFAGIIVFYVIKKNKR